VVKTERGRQKSRFRKRYDMINMNVRERKKEREGGRGEREVRSKLGMERDMVEVGLGYIWFMCLLY